MQLGYLLGGSILIETVFSWPGTGLLLNDAIFQRDLPLLQGTILVLAMFFVVLNSAGRRAADGARSAHRSGAEHDARRHAAADADASRITRSPGYWATVWRRFRRDPVAVGALVRDPAAHAGRDLRALDRAARPLSRHDAAPPAPARHATAIPLGTDELGRDMLSRLIYGARLSLFMGVTPVFLALVIGSAIGIVGRLCRRPASTRMLMRTIDVFFAFPSVLLAIALSGALGAGITNGLISLTVVFIPPIARVAESVTTSVRTRDYVEAARASGAGALHDRARARARQRARARSSSTP